MRFFIILIFLSSILIVSSTNCIASLQLNDQQSYAQEYKKLRVLLEMIKSSETAIMYKQVIEQQIKYLNDNHLSGEESFNAMSVEDKKSFIKKFQNNHFHCGEVTQVMTERQRILLQLDLANILRDTLSEIP